MTTPAGGTLGDSVKPPKSLAVLERLGEQGVRVSIPPPIRRTWVKAMVAAEILGCLVGPSLLVLTIGNQSLMPFAGVLVTAVACSTLVVTLWMGFRWTIVDAGPDGLRVELRGLLAKQERVYPRERIGDLRKTVSLIVLDPNGRRIGKIDATDPSEERWLMHVLREAMQLPPA